MRRTLVLLLLPAFAALACDAGPQDLSPGGHAPVIRVIAPTTQPAVEDENAKVRAALKQKLPKVEFADISAEKAFDYFRDVTGLNVVVRWAALTSVGIDQTTPVSIKLQDVPVETAIEKVLEEVGGVNPLSFVVENGVVTISTKDELSRHTVVRVYDVRDLASAEPVFSGDDPDEFELMIRLIDEIKSIVEPSSWRPTGEVGDIRAMSGNLVVLTTANNQDEIEALLASLRKVRFPQWERDLKQKVERTEISLDLQGVRFRDAVDALRDACGVNVVLAPAVTAKPPQPLTLKAEKITLRQVLNLLARMEGLNWTLSDGVIYISRPKGAVPEPIAAVPVGKPSAQPSTPPTKQASGPPSTQPAVTEAAIQANASDLKSTIVTACLDQEIPKNKSVLWCASFQLAWNALMDYAGGPVEMDGGPAMVDALNQRAFGKDDMDDASVVAVAGQVGEGVLAKAREELRRKFPDFTPRLLPAESQWGPTDVIAYACLIKEMPFEHPFNRGSMAFGAHSFEEEANKVASFGQNGYSAEKPEEVATAAQVRVLWHRFGPDSDGDRQSFIVELLTKAGDDRLILAVIPPKGTLAETIGEVTSRMATPNTLMPKKVSSAEGGRDSEPEANSKYACLLPNESLDVPVLDFDILREFKELYGPPVKAKNPKLNGYFIKEAKQSILFKLNETGAKLVSEAVIGLFGSAPARKRDFTFNRPFLVMLMRKGSTKPYFAAWIANRELLVKAPAEAATTQPAAGQGK